MAYFYKYLLIYSLLSLFELSIYADSLICDIPIKDFGEINEGEKLTYTFKVKNISDKKIFVNRTLSSCGCLVTSKKQFALEPNEIVDIPVEFNSRDYGGGKFEKNITLVVEEGKQEIPFKLLIKGQVKGIKAQDRVYISPEQKYIYNEKSQKHRIFIRAPLKKDLEISLKTPKCIKADIVKTKENEALGFTEWEIVFSLVEDIEKRFNTDITVFTNVPFFEKAFIPIYIEPKPAVIANPPILFIEKENSNASCVRELEITLLENLFGGKNSNPINTEYAKLKDDDLKKFQISTDTNILPIFVKPSNDCVSVILTNVSNDFTKIKYEIRIKDCQVSQLNLQIMTEKTCVQNVPIYFLPKHPQ